MSYKPTRRTLFVYFQLLASKTKYPAVFVLPSIVNYTSVKLTSPTINYSYKSLRFLLISFVFVQYEWIRENYEPTSIKFISKLTYITFYLWSPFALPLSLSLSISLSISISFPLVTLFETICNLKKFTSK